MKKYLVSLFFLLSAVMMIKPQIDLSYDSPRYLTIAQSITYGNGYNFIYRPDNAPVFYNNYILPYFLAPLIRIFGINPYLLKAVMLLLGLFALFFFLGWMKTYLKEKELLFLSIALIYTPLFIRFCDKVLTEALFVFFLTASFLLLKKYSISKNKIFLILLLICCYCAIFTKIAGIFILIPLFIYIKTDKDKKLALSTVILIAVSAITVFIIQSRLPDNNRFYHIKYLLYKDAFTPDLGYIKPGDLLLRIIYNIR
ncbi:MAG TPA: phospholipid carrier-dependent glycosyltransferase, partial [Candidatus Omnitrophica bacterium]|nr:phospholipid carrier-dependent glycosyltransferase [Candidatus Omnitrophota bacterium]